MGSASPVSGRCVYGGAAEVSIYVAERARSRGIGIALLRPLIVQSELNGIWALRAAIFPENESNIPVTHERGIAHGGNAGAVGADETADGATSC